MTITHYFIDFGHSSATKNKPQHEAWAYLNSLNGMLILKEDLQETQEVIIENIKVIFERHPRCKALDITFSERTTEKIVWMDGFQAVSFKFAPAVLIPSDNLWSFLSQKNKI